MLSSLLESSTQQNALDAAEQREQLFNEALERWRPIITTSLTEKEYDEDVREKSAAAAAVLVEPVAILEPIQVDDDDDDPLLQEVLLELSHSNIITPAPAPAATTNLPAIAAILPAPEEDEKTMISVLSSPAEALPQDATSSALLIERFLKEQAQWRETWSSNFSKKP